MGYSMGAVRKRSKEDTKGSEFSGVIRRPLPAPKGPAMAGQECCPDAQRTKRFVCQECWEHWDAGRGNKEGSGEKYMS